MTQLIVDGEPMSLSSGCENGTSLHVEREVEIVFSGGAVSSDDTWLIFTSHPAEFLCSSWFTMERGDPPTPGALGAWQSMPRFKLEAVEPLSENVGVVRVAMVNTCSSGTGNRCETDRRKKREGGWLRKRVMFFCLSNLFFPTRAPLSGHDRDHHLRASLSASAWVAAVEEEHEFSASTLSIIVARSSHLFRHGSTIGHPARILEHPSLTQGFSLREILRCEKRGEPDDREDYGKLLRAHAEVYPTGEARVSYSSSSLDWIQDALQV